MWFLWQRKVRVLYKWAQEALVLGQLVERLLLVSFGTCPIEGDFKELYKKWKGFGLVLVLRLGLRGVQ